MKTLRFSKDDPQRFNSDDPHCPAFMIFWHNRAFSVPYLFSTAVKQNSIAVVSQSNDGQYITDFLLSFGVKSVRGSSSKGGTKALRQMIDLVKEKKLIGLIPDGPRGPKYKLKPGVAFAAMKTDAPVVPVSVNCSSYWELNSWDDFQIPKPFSKVVFKVGKFVYLENNKELFQEHIKTLEKALMDVTEDK